MWVDGVCCCQLLTDFTNATVFFDRNPLYLGIIFVTFLLLKALWVQLDVSGEFRNGVVSELFFKYYLSLAYDMLFHSVAIFSYEISNSAL